MCILLLILMSFSCNDDDREQISIYFGSAEAKLNLVTFWNSEVRSSTSIDDISKIGIRLDRFNNQFLIEKLNFRNIHFSVGNKMRLFSDKEFDCVESCVTFTTGEDDIAGDFYDGLEYDELENWIVFDSINIETMEYWARFQASFVRDERIPKWGSLPDTLYFSEGNIHGKVTER